MSRRLQQGLSLIELMVALLLSGLLLLGLVEIFSASRASYQMAQGLARAQESSRFAIDALQRDARMSGHFGCVSDQAHFYAGNGMFGELFLGSRNNYADIPAPREALRFDYSVRGYEARNTGPADTLSLTADPVAGSAGDWVPAITSQFFSSLNPKPVRGSDLLVLRFLSPESAEVTGFTTGNPATIRVNPANTQWGSLTRAVTNPGLFGIADCRSVVLFQASAIADVTGAKVVTVRTNGVNQIAFDGSDTFASGQARLYRADSYLYYVGLKPGVNDFTGKPIPTLYRARFDAAPGTDTVVSTAEEIVEGVENMQLLFAQDMITDPAQPPTGVIDGVRTAANLLPTNDSSGGWQRVGGLQVGLLIRSTDPASAQQRTAATRSLGTQLTLPDDQRYRTVYETNIALRNRLYGN
ncbi:PilW family protein [Lysobacter antibioticus]|uniref:Prepilin-type N-terminal cleavage/methylation domain protein n=1 Tax=Lysobacter antibioticus TaxID=84531 RepID=A0A0S2F8L1_LYSAN|nr:PilW family protein [Lysobacter antibioticus]ALN79893.1 prepilin-type N-terminal cleavage/methylation domain protein [Lysobacter antibioticus]